MLPAGTRTIWALVAVSAALTLVFAGLVARHLSNDARRASASYATVFRGLTDPREGAASEALLALVQEINAAGIPVVVTNATGFPTDTANLPRTMAFDSPELREFVARLDRVNPPVTEPTVGTIHFGAPPVRTPLRIVFALELVSLLAVLGAGLIAWRVSIRAARGRVFVAMARESAHQMGTPLTSFAGWIEQLKTGSMAPADIARHLEDDYARLERVSRRFERIGQPPREEPVDVGALAQKVAGYFRPRLPKLANQVTIDVAVDSRMPVARGDALLLEWALEVLVKNGVDALKGRSGFIKLAVKDEPDALLITVWDNGPGVPAEVRAQLFEPGLSTKTGGWGLGLALTRRIVEDNHGGKLTLEDVQDGARFAIRLPRAGSAA